MSGIGFVPESETRFYAKLPKVHLHSHILGMVPVKTFVELAEKHSLQLGGKAPEELYRYYDFKRFVEILSDIAAVIQDEEDYSRVIHDSIVEAYQKERVLYSELFVQVTYHLIYGTSYQKMISGFVDGIRRAEKELPVRARLILGLNRQLPAPMATQIVREAIKYPSEYVIGIGLEDYEGFGPPEDFVQAYALAKSARLHRTAHAGEAGPPQNVIKALTCLACERIDHGYQAVNDPTIIYRLAENRVHFTTCPTVSSRQGWAKPDGHVLKKMYDHGLWISFHADDPAIIGSDLNREYALAAKFIGIGREEMTAIAKRTIDAAWMSEAEKLELHEQFDSELKRSL